METYYLYTLLCFLRQQREIGYATIESVLDIIEDETLQPEDKKDVIKFWLRKAGLNETTFKGGRYLPAHARTEEIPNKILELDHREYNGCLIVQTISVTLMTGGTLFEFCLN